MSTRKSTNKAATDSPVSTSSDTSSTRSTTTRSSVQTPVNESDPLDTSMTIDTKRPRRTNVRTPTTPSNSIKKKSDESPESMSTGSGDPDDDKNLKSPSDDTKSEDGKKTDSSLTESPARAARKRKVFDKTAIITRNTTKRVLRGRQSSIGKGENLENETRRRGPKKSTSSTPEPPTTLKRKRDSSVKPEEKEEAKRGEKVMKFESVEGDDSSDQMPIDMKEEDKLKLLVEETDSKDDELVEVLQIKQEIEEDAEEMSLDESVVKDQSGTPEPEEQEDSKLEESSCKLADELTDEGKQSDSGEEKDLNKSPLGEDQKDAKKATDEIIQTEAADQDKKVIVRAKEVKVEEDARYEAYERPRRARTKRLTETPPTPAKRGGKKSEDTPETKAKGGRRNQSKSLPADANKSEESKSDPAVETKAKEVPTVDNKTVAQETVNGVEQPLIVDTSSSTSTAEKGLPETNLDGNSEKAASLSPELVSEGVNVMSVKQFYKKPEFLENNLGIEKDPKLGEIVQEAEKTKDGNDRPEITSQMPSNSREVVAAAAVEKPVESIESSPDCSGDSLKEGERLILDDSTEEDASTSTNKVEGNIDEATCAAVDSTEIATDFSISEDSELTKLKVEDVDEEEKKEGQEEILSNSASIGDVDALQTNCDKNSSNSAVVTDDGRAEEGCARGDSDIKDKIACNKSSIEEVGVSDKQENIEECCVQVVVIETSGSSSNVVEEEQEEEEAPMESSEQMLRDADLEEDPLTVEADGGDKTTALKDESEAEELKVEEEDQEEGDAMDIDEANDDKENVAEDADVQCFKENVQNCVNTPKKVSLYFFLFFSKC